MNKKLELTWYGKEKEIKVEPRILIEDKEKSNCKNDENTKNMLIHGDNLLALKALESKYAGKIKCVYIDEEFFYLVEIKGEDKIDNEDVKDRKLQQLNIAK